MKLKNIKNWLISLMLSCVVAFVAHAQARLSDAQIAEIVEQANEAEIAIAEIVDSNAASKEVKKMALELILLHEKSSRDLQMIIKDASINPVPSKISNNIRKVGKAKKKEFKNKKLNDFDKNYVDQQIIIYQKFVIELDKKLIPFAQKQELKEYLMKERNEIADQMEKIKTLQKTL